MPPDPAAPSTSRFPPSLLVLLRRARRREIEEPALRCALFRVFEDWLEPQRGRAHVELEATIEDAKVEGLPSFRETKMHKTLQRVLDSYTGSTAADVQKGFLFPDMHVAIKCDCAPDCDHKQIGETTEIKALCTEQVLEQRAERVSLAWGVTTSRSILALAPLKRSHLDLADDGLLAIRRLVPDVVWEGFKNIPAALGPAPAVRTSPLPLMEWPPLGEGMMAHFRTQVLSRDADKKLRLGLAQTLAYLLVANESGRCIRATCIVGTRALRIVLAGSQATVELNPDVVADDLSTRLRADDVGVSDVVTLVTYDMIPHDILTPAEELDLDVLSLLQGGVSNAELRMSGVDTLDEDSIQHTVSVPTNSESSRLHVVGGARPKTARSVQALLQEEARGHSFSDTIATATKKDDSDDDAPGDPAGPSAQFHGIRPRQAGGESSQQRDDEPERAAGSTHTGKSHAAILLPDGDVTEADLAGLNDDNEALSLGAEADNMARSVPQAINQGAQGDGEDTHGQFHPDEVDDALTSRAITELRDLIEAAKRGDGEDLEQAQAVKAWIDRHASVATDIYVAALQDVGVRIRVVSPTDMSKLLEAHHSSKSLKTNLGVDPVTDAAENTPALTCTALSGSGTASPQSPGNGADMPASIDGQLALNKRARDADFTDDLPEPTRRRFDVP